MLSLLRILNRGQLSLDCLSFGFIRKIDT
nr:DUF645 family protein [Vibrio sp. S234-5]